MAEPTEERPLPQEETLPKEPPQPVVTGMQSPDRQEVAPVAPEPTQQQIPAPLQAAGEAFAKEEANPITQQQVSGGLQKAGEEYAGITPGAPSQQQIPAEEQEWGGQVISYAQSHQVPEQPPQPTPDDLERLFGTVLQAGGMVKDTANNLAKAVVPGLGGLEDIIASNPVQGALNNLATPFLGVLGAIGIAVTDEPGKGPHARFNQIVSEKIAANPTLVHNPGWLEWTALEASRQMFMESPEIPAAVKTAATLIDPVQWYSLGILGKLGEITRASGQAVEAVRAGNQAVGRALAARADTAAEISGGVRYRIGAGSALENRAGGVVTSDALARIQAIRGEVGLRGILLGEAGAMTPENSIGLGLLKSAAAKMRQGLPLEPAEESAMHEASSVFALPVKTVRPIEGGYKTGAMKGVDAGEATRLVKEHGFASRQAFEAHVLKTPVEDIPAPLQDLARRTMAGHLETKGVTAEVARSYSGHGQSQGLADKIEGIRAKEARGESLTDSERATLSPESAEGQAAQARLEAQPPTAEAKARIAEFQTQMRARQAESAGETLAHQVENIGTRPEESAKLAETLKASGATPAEIDYALGRGAGGRGRGPRGSTTGAMPPAHDMNELAKNLERAINTPRQLEISGSPFHGAFRHGLPFLGAFPKAWARGVKGGAETLGRDLEATNARLSALKQQAQEVMPSLRVNDLHGGIVSGEESVAGFNPRDYLGAFGEGMARSNDAFVMVNNEIRVAAGTAWAVAHPGASAEMLDRAGRVINTFSGIGIGKGALPLFGKPLMSEAAFSKVARGLNVITFAPSMQMSRIKMLLYTGGAFKDLALQVARHETLDPVNLLTLRLGAGYLVSMFGEFALMNGMKWAVQTSQGQTFKLHVDTDMRSTNFMRVEMGKKSEWAGVASAVAAQAGWTVVSEGDLLFLDTSAGIQTYVRDAAQLLTGTSGTGKALNQGRMSTTYADIIANLANSRLNTPLAETMTALRNKNDPGTSPGDVLLKMLLPFSAEGYLEGSGREPFKALGEKTRRAPSPVIPGAKSVYGF